MAKLDHICVDIETLSTQTNAVIVSVAAVKFNLVSDEQETFSVNINPFGSKALGLHICKETIDWWKEQKPNAAKAWQTSQIGLEKALTKFNEFCGQSNSTHYWSLGTDFDFPILKSSFQAVDMKEPWKYYNLHDMRTAYYLAGLDTRTLDRIGVYHNSVDDCLTQISWLKVALGIKI